jgi:hypothetical protein
VALAIRECWYVTCFVVYERCARGFLFVVRKRPAPSTQCSLHVCHSFSALSPNRLSSFMSIAVLVLRAHACSLRLKVT